MLFYFWLMTSALRIGLVQFDPAWENPQANIDRLDELVSSNQNLDLLVLPEMWSTGFTMHSAYAQDMHGSALEWMIRKASVTQCHIAGSLAIKENGLRFNRFFCVSPQGDIHHYDKKHLFSYGRENQHYSPGSHPLTFKIGNWKIRAIICYDLRFPVWCRNTDAYDLLLVVANWPEARIHHWDTLLRARAIENQSYVVGVNRLGTDGNHLVYNGHSAGYDMNGHSLLEMGVGEGIGHLVMDMEKLKQFRLQYPFLQDQDKFSL